MDKARDGMRSFRGREERPCHRPSGMKGEYGYRLTKDVPCAAPLGKARCRSDASELVRRGPERSYPNLRTRRLRKIHNVAGPKFFKAVGPLLRL
jgi:hypothetical protein